MMFSVFAFTESRVDASVAASSCASVRREDAADGASGSAKSAGADERWRDASRGAARRTDGVAAADRAKLSIIRRGGKERIARGGKEGRERERKREEEKDSERGLQREEST